jgi:hypothetical protein
MVRKAAAHVHVVLRACRRSLAVAQQFREPRQQRVVSVGRQDRPFAQSGRTNGHAVQLAERLEGVQDEFGNICIICEWNSLVSASSLAGKQMMASHVVQWQQRSGGKFRPLVRPSHSISTITSVSRRCPQPCTVPFAIFAVGIMPSLQVMRNSCPRKPL